LFQCGDDALDSGLDCRDRVFEPNGVVSRLARRAPADQPGMPLDDRKRGDEVWNQQGVEVDRFRGFQDDIFTLGKH